MTRTRRRNFLWFLWRRIRVRTGVTRTRRRNFLLGLAVMFVIVGGLEVQSVMHEESAKRAAATRAATLGDDAYAAIDLRELANHRQAYIGKLIQVRGVVVGTKNEARGSALVVAGTGDQAGASVVVRDGGTSPARSPRVQVTVYGIGDGNEATGRGHVSEVRPAMRADRIVPRP